MYTENYTLNNTQTKTQNNNTRVKEPYKKDIMYIIYNINSSQLHGNFEKIEEMFHTEYQLRNLRHLREPHVQGILSSSNGNL